MYALTYLVLVLGLGGVWQDAPPIREGAESAPQSMESAASPAERAAARPAAEVLSLRSDLERAIRSPGWRGDDWGVLVLSLDRGDTLYARSPATPLTPASNLKLFTSAAALYYLGPEYRYATYLLAGGPIRDGMLEGDLILYGTGDPTISDRFQLSRMAVWSSFADSLAALGVTEIRGAVVGDGSYFGPSATGLGWRERYRSAWYAAPSSALSFNDNVVTLRIRPGEAPGWRPEILFVPRGDGVPVVNQATTVQGGATRIRVDRAGYDGPIVIRGQIAMGNPGVWHQVPVPDPARYAAGVLRSYLEARGIAVRDGVRSVFRRDESPVSGRLVFAPAYEHRPALRVLAVHRSPPLEEVLALINRQSHNLSADQVLRTIGRIALGDGSLEAGVRAMVEFLEREVGVGSIQAYDGSGLSAMNRSTAGDLVALLRYMADSPMFESFWATLPVAGSQQLRRMAQTPAERNLRAKTGTIEGVSALSGYVQAANGERLAFAVISNNVPSTWRAKRVEDAIGARLARFRRPVIVDGAPEGPPEVPPAAARGTVGATHVIRPGDTMAAIARRYGTTVSAIQEANPGLDARRLMPGRTLLLPGD